MTKFIFRCSGVMFLLFGIIDILSFIKHKEQIDQFGESIVNFGMSYFFLNKGFRTYIIEVFRGLNKET